MERSAVRSPVLYYLVPGLLVLVACLQLWRAHAHHLTPWKGGGFGMFSTADSPGKRTLRTYLITPEGEALALYGTLSIQENRVLGMPDTKTLEQIARETAAQSWAIYSFDEVLDEIASLPEELREYLARTPAMERRRQQRRRAQALARADSLGEPVDRTLLALDTTAVVSYPDWVAFAQPRPRPAATDEPDLRRVRVEVWSMRYDQEHHRAMPELLNSVTLDLD